MIIKCDFRLRGNESCDKTAVIFSVLHIYEYDMFWARCEKHGGSHPEITISEEEYIIGTVHEL